MSQRLISLSSDLKKLRDEGFDLEVHQQYLLVRDVPYVNASREVSRGTLVFELNLAGDITARPATHVARFQGSYPCDLSGRELEQIRHSGSQQLTPDLSVDFQFSSKLAGGVQYEDYYQQVTAYVAILQSQAQAIHPDASAKTFPVIAMEEDESIFNYLDTASSRARINLATNKLELARAAIVGVGGTGSYVMDLVAKTPVGEIHLFDGDVFLSHNAFRAPGAAPIEELREKQNKATYFTQRYSALRRGIVAHPYAVDVGNVAELGEMDFVFLCIDANETKRQIVDSLEAFEVPFVDVGMGVNLVEDSLRGICRVTSNLPGRREGFRARVPLADAGGDDDYDTNIQVADLNGLSAALAVIKWKKIQGFYLDFESELNTLYSIDTNLLVNESFDET